jgi:hypothetical protein
MTAYPKYGYSNTPFYYLGKYKTTQRPRVCVRCGQSAYYYHDDWDWVCAAHLLDLVNIGQLAFKWADYEEVWQRTERLLQRAAPSSTGVKNTVYQYGKNAVEDEEQWDTMSLQALLENDE